MKGSVVESYYLLIQAVEVPSLQARDSLVECTTGRESGSSQVGGVREQPGGRSLVGALHWLSLPLLFSRQIENAYAPCEELIFWLSEEYSSQPHPCTHHWSHKSSGIRQPEWLPWLLTLHIERMHLWKHGEPNVSPFPIQNQDTISTHSKTNLIFNSKHTDASFCYSLLHMYFL